MVKIDRLRDDANKRILKCQEGMVGGLLGRIRLKRY